MSGEIKLKYYESFYDNSSSNLTHKDSSIDYKLIALDDIKLNGDDDKDKINNYLKTNIVFDYIILSNGKIHKITPPNYRGNACKFDVYSQRLIKELPKLCPILTKYSKDLLPDQAIISIACESTNNGRPTFEQEASLKNLIAYLMNRYSITPSKLLTRSMIPGREKKKQELGHSYYKTNISDLITIASYSLRMSKMMDLVPEVMQS